MARAIKNKCKRQKIFEKTDYHCYYCGTELKDGNATIDHVKPMDAGGGNGYTNLVPSCKSCNSKKGTKTIDDFRFYFSREKQGIPNFSIEQSIWLSTKGISEHIPEMEKFYGEQ